MMAEDGMTPADILASWPGEGPPKPGRRTLDQDLVYGYSQGLWNRFGKGVRSDPFLFAQTP